jgi:septal ring factor EnvC (AmiA/AmiB activator)
VVQQAEINRALQEDYRRLDDEVRKIGQAATTLVVRAETVEKDIQQITEDQKSASESLQEVDKKLAVIEERLNELKRVTEEAGRRRFSLWQGVLCGFLGAVLAFAGQLGLTALKPYLEQAPKVSH